MLPIYSSSQIKKIEELICLEQNINSSDLMERAGISFCKWFIENWKADDRTIHIFCGNGNNGGDGLVVARHLKLLNFDVKVYLLNISNKSSEYFNLNLKKLQGKNISIQELSISEIDKNIIKSSDIIIDAILGNGTTRSIEVQWTNLIQTINNLPNQKTSIDLPSGISTDQILNGQAIQADWVFGFEFPKIAYLLQENQNYIRNWTLGSIGFTKNTPHEIEAEYYLNEISDFVKIIKVREKFSHKYNYGHVGIVAGSSEMCGAAFLACRASLRAGCGLVSLFTDESCKSGILQSLPETIIYSSEKFTTESLSKFNSILLGPGMKDVNELEKFLHLSFDSNKALVLDAEAINVLSSNSYLLEKIPEGCILTPHVGECDRLLKKRPKDSLERLHLLQEFTNKHKIIVVLKGPYTAIIQSNKKIHFNNSGNQGMATAGSGDVLAGIIVSLLAQRYTSEEASMLGVFLHGLAADLALEKQSFESLIASDIIEYLGLAFKHLNALGRTQ